MCTGSAWLMWTKPLGLVGYGYVFYQVLLFVDCMDHQTQRNITKSLHNVKELVHLIIWVKVITI